MEKTFRLVQAEEQPQIEVLYKEATGDMRSRGIFQWDEKYPTKREFIADIGNRQMYALIHEGEIVSAVVINEEQEEEYGSGDWKHHGRIAVIHRLCVRPAHQGKGHGGETVLRAEEIMREMGYTAVRLDAFSQNPFALKLYERLGYERAGEVRFRTGVFFLYEKLL